MAEKAKTLEYRDKVEIFGDTYTVMGNKGHYFLNLQFGNNARLFKKLNPKGSKVEIIKKMIGDPEKVTSAVHRGDFPYVDTLETLTKVVEAFQNITV